MRKFSLSSERGSEIGARIFTVMLAVSLCIPNVLLADELSTDTGTPSAAPEVAISTGTLTVKKVVVGSDVAPSAFSIHVKQDGSEISNSPQPGNVDGTTYSELATGSYTVSETGGPEGYTTTFSGACDSETGIVNVNGDGIQMCTITNTLVNQCTARPKDIMVVLDRSGSIDDGEMANLKTAAMNFVGAINPTSGGNHIGVVSFSTDATLDQPLTSDGTMADTAINNLAHDGLTNLHDAITTASTELADSARDRVDTSAPDVMVIITDGQPTTPCTFAQCTPSDDAKAAAAAAKAAGTEVFVLGVGADVNANFLKNNIATDSAHYFDVSDFASLNSILTQVPTCSHTGTLIVHKVVVGSNASPATFSFAVNGGASTAFNADGTNSLPEEPGDYVVSETAAEGFSTSFSGDCNADGHVTVLADGTASCTITNTSTNQCTARPKDIMVVLDRSGSIDDGEMANLKTAAMNFVGAINPTSGGNHIGVVSFSTDATLDQPLTSDGTMADTAINNLAHDGLTNLHDAITTASTELADSARDRVDTSAPDVMVIITDGQPTTPCTFAQCTPSDDAKAAAAAAKAAGTEVFVLGVGADVNANFLKNNIATDSAHYFDVSDFASLNSILTQVPTCSHTGTLIVHKVVVGSNASPATFSFAVNNGDPIAFNADGVNSLPENSGTYTVTEVAVEGYTISYDKCSEVTVPDDGTATCTITNTFNNQNGGGGGGGDNGGNGGGSGGNGGGGGGVPGGGNICVGANCGSGGGSGSSTPQVLGAETGPFTPPGSGSTTPTGEVLGETSCTPYLLEYIHFGRKNNPVEVKKLQTFLNNQGFGPLDVDGNYSWQDFLAVQKFQIAHFIEVLRPWVPFGLPTEKTPTGYVYKTTKRWINMIMCPSLDLPIPPLP